MREKTDNQTGKKARRKNKSHYKNKVNTRKTKQQKGREKGGGTEKCLKKKVNTNTILSFKVHFQVEPSRGL